jgi:transglutaminase-like putative cysteine protease
MSAAAVAGCSSKEQADTPDRSGTEGSNKGEYVSRSEYEELRQEYEDLRERYQNLRERALVPPYITTGQRTATVTFETLSGEIDTWSWDSSALTAQNTTGSIIRELSYSELEYVNLNDFGFEGGSKYQQLGDFGSYYQLNPFVISSNFTPLAEDFYNRNQSDGERIREAWNFVTQINEYVADIGETPRFPLETLLLGGGDCEDSAILLASILYSMPTDLNTEFWYMDIDNPANPQNINHVIVGAETDEKAYLIETTGTQMQPYEKVDGFPVDVSPSQ